MPSTTAWLRLTVATCLRNMLPMTPEKPAELVAAISKVEAQIASVDSQARQRDAAHVAGCRRVLASGQPLDRDAQLALLDIAERAVSDLSAEFERQIDN
jgi:hypothetical protein